MRFISIFTVLNKLLCYQTVEDCIKLDFNCSDPENALKKIMDKKGCNYSKKYAVVLRYLLSAIGSVGINNYNMSYMKLLDAILINAKKDNKEISLYSWDVDKNANVVNIDISENGKHIFNKIDGLFNLNLGQCLT